MKKIMSGLVTTGIHTAVNGQSLLGLTRGQKPLLIFIITKSLLLDTKLLR